jgi:Family of unknown function (DUF6502)
VRMYTASDTATSDPHSAEQQQLLAALQSVLAPFAQLCVAKGIRIQVIEELVRSAFVDAAIEAHPARNSDRIASRISATTGLTRREVTRLAKERKPPVRQPRSPITELFTRWLSSPALQDGRKNPLELPRQGPAPSFESLAHSVTRDVHPRTLLEELCRLQLGRHDTETDTVHLLQDAFVPRGDWPRLMAFLGDNVGDHLRSAVANVLADGKQQLEQAIYADELSVEGVAKAQALMAHQWRTLLAQVSPQLERLIEEDCEAGRVQDQCMRIGLFTWSQAMPPETPAETPSVTPLASKSSKNGKPPKKLP